MIEDFKCKEEFKCQLLLEQYRQAAEECRAEDQYTWKTFAIILAINGALIGFLDFDSTNFFIFTICTAFIGICSVIAGILIIGRSQLYQQYRASIAEKIQKYTDIQLYFTGTIENHIEPELINRPLKWYEKKGGRKRMRILLMLIGCMWIILGVIVFVKYITKI